jgi:hypothetical protein
MPDDAVLREFARFAIQQGRLPRRDPDHGWGGLGCGALCAVCEKPVTGNEPEHEIEFGQDLFHLHVSCFTAWELERAKPAG